MQETGSGDAGLGDRSDLEIGIRIVGVGVLPRLAVDLDIGVGIKRRGKDVALLCPCP